MDLENLNSNELNSKFIEVVGEYKSLYLRSVEDGIHLFNADSKCHLIELNQDCE